MAEGSVEYLRLSSLAEMPDILDVERTREQNKVATVKLKASSIMPLTLNQSVTTLRGRCHCASSAKRWLPFDIEVNRDGLVQLGRDELLKRWSSAQPRANPTPRDMQLLDADNILVEILGRTCSTQIIVTHGFTLRIAAWMKVTIEACGFLAYPAPKASITHLRQDDFFRNKALVTFAAISHLKR